MSSFDCNVRKTWSGNTKHLEGHRIVAFALRKPGKASLLTEGGNANWMLFFFLIQPDLPQRCLPLSLGSRKCFPVPGVLGSASKGNKGFAKHPTVPLAWVSCKAATRTSRRCPCRFYSKPKTWSCNLVGKCKSNRNFLERTIFSRCTI